MPDFSCPSQYLLHLVLGISYCFSLRSVYDLSYPCRSWSLTSDLFEHMDINFFLAPVTCTTPTSNVNHTVLKIVLLFSLKRCEQVIYHLWPQNWSLSIRVSNPLTTRKLCMVRWLIWWVIWAGRYLSNAGSFAFHPCLWIKTNWQWLQPFCWHIMYHQRTSLYFSAEMS